ncbi:MAG TPA: hypothetical protein VFU31_02665 [Candidatus Binatia bacterium]|nr:hypothetical protein [Candidatus Binatia bacterium]
MSWWIISYFVLFAVLAAGGLWDDWRDRRPAWFLGCALLSNVIIAYLFVAFWQPSLRAPLGVVAQLAFAASICWELFQLVQDIHGLHSDPELSERQQRLYATVVAIAVPLICLPAFLIAGITAFRL